MPLPSQVYSFLTLRKMNVKSKSLISQDRKLIIIFIKPLICRRFPACKRIFVLDGLVDH